MFHLSRPGGAGFVILDVRCTAAETRWFLETVLSVPPSACM